jgi:hypothetical protein
MLQLIYLSFALSNLLGELLQPLAMFAHASRLPLRGLQFGHDGFALLFQLVAASAQVAPMLLNLFQHSLQVGCEGGFAQLLLERGEALLVAHDGAQLTLADARGGEIDLARHAPVLFPTPQRLFAFMLVTLTPFLPVG